MPAQTFLDGTAPGEPLGLTSMGAFADVNELPPQQIWDGLLARTVHGDRMTLTLIELEPDTDVPEHRHENEQMGILARRLAHVPDRRRDEGVRARRHLGDRRPGPAFSVTAGPEGAVLVEVFSPVRDDWQARDRLSPRPGRWP